MTRRNWIQLFSHDQSFELSNELERGYEAALLIQSLELEYYADRPVRPDLELSVPRQVQLTILRRFRSALNICRASKAAVEPKRGQLDVQELRQLQLIETVVARYAPGRSSQRGKISREPEPLPRSLLSFFDSMRRQLDPSAEETLVAGFRRRRDSTLISLRLVLLLILVPLMVQQISRTYLISPVVDRLAPDLGMMSYPKEGLEAKSVEKLRIYKEEIEFEALLSGVETPTGDAMREKLKVKAEQLNRENTFESLQAVKNVFSDLAAVVAFVVVCFASRDELRVLRGFIDEAIYGLSDSAKAFGIILFTDIFVGYHSPEGWTVLLGGVAKHFGLPAQENFIMLFIATFPVILATIFKYWIFRYLNRVSPSSVATLKGMNGGG